MQHAQLPGSGQTLFSIAALPTSERWSAYQELLRIHRKVECTSREKPFFAEAMVGLIPDLSVACFTTTAMRAVRNRALADQSDDLVLYMCFEGTAHISHLGRQATLSAGECILLASSNTYSMNRSAIHASSVSIPRPLLGPMIADVDRALMVPMPMSGSVFSLLSNYLAALKDDPGVSEPMLRGVASAHVRDLVAVAIGATRDAAEFAKGNGLRVARLRAIKDDIAQNLCSEVLSSDALAQRHRVSSRYVRKLFESEGTTLSRFVLHMRLARVHRLLNDPRHTYRTIGEIVYETGFGDLSTFNHAFRHHYGMTPSDIRHRRADII